MDIVTRWNIPPLKQSGKKVNNVEKVMLLFSKVKYKMVLRHTFFIFLVDGMCLKIFATK